MSAQSRRRRILRRALIAALVIACIALAVAAAALVPILTHRSAGSSGQEVPEGFVAAASAEGADGRTRTLAVETEGGEPADLAQLSAGDVLIVRGAGFDPGIGIYVAICAVPSLPDEKPAPCLGGVPEGATEAKSSAEAAAAEPQASVWVTDDWAWRAFATQGYEADGSFTARLLVAASAQEGLDCAKALCAVTTRADHTASSDRVQDMQLPVRFAG